MTQKQRELFANAAINHNGEVKVKIEGSKELMQYFDVLIAALSKTPYVATNEALKNELQEIYDGIMNERPSDGTENYTTGYHNGHRNGQVELLQYILDIDTGFRVDSKEDNKNTPSTDPLIQAIEEEEASRHA
jgi:hypothetical protein